MKNESITITPAANGYIVSKFDDDTPDMVFETFKGLLAFLQVQLDTSLKSPVLGAGGILPPGQLVAGELGDPTNYLFPTEETQAPSDRRTDDTKCFNAAVNGGSGCEICDYKQAAPKTIF